MPDGPAGASPPSPAPGEALFVLVAAWLLTAPIALLLFHRYRSAVRTLMASATGPPPPARVRDASEGTPVGAPDYRVLGCATAAAAADGPVARRATSGPRALAAAYGFAGLVHAAIATVALMLEEGIAFDPRRAAFVFHVLSWTALMAATGAAVVGLRRALVVGVAFLAAGALVWGSDGGRFLLVWAIFMGAPTLLVLSVTNRRLGGTGVILFALTAAAAAGAVLGARALSAVVDVGIAAIHRSRDPGQADLLWTAAGLAVLGACVAAAVIAAWKFAGRIARSYVRKRTSDQTLVIDAAVLLLTTWQCLLPSNVAGLGALGGMAAFVGYKLAQRAAFRVIAAGRGDARDVRLLLLRVFRGTGRSERLMDRFGARWRHVGCVALVAAPDLATASFEPHEVVAFLSRRVGDSFIGSAADAEARVRAMDAAPDPDGRHRVNEFFCRDNAWRTVVRLLLRETDAVLVDVRAISPANQGIRFEIEEIVDTVSTARVVLVADGETDLDLVKSRFDEAWARMDPASPNRGRPAPITIVRFEGRRSAETLRLVEAVAAAAASSPR